MKSTKIAFIGSRGIPANYGGFETFVEELAVGLKQQYDFDIVVVGDTHQKEQLNSITKYKGVEVIYSKYSKSNQTVQFYLDSMLKAWSADVIYCCGVGNAFFLLLPSLFSKKFVTNPDGIGWERLKWSNTGKKVLKFMFYLTAKISPYIVTDSAGVESIFKTKFKRKNNIETIEYGSYLNQTNGVQSTEIDAVLQNYKLKSGEYHLVVSRLEPENNVHLIINGFAKSKSKYPLIIVGDIMDTDYVKTLTVPGNNNVIFIGGIYDKFELKVVRSNAVSYFHGHSVGGTNPSLLEAMASKNICVCHDNEFNRGVVGLSGFYFNTAKDVSDIILDIEKNKYSNYRNEVFEKVKNHYNWENIVKMYADYFKKIAY